MIGGRRITVIDIHAHHFVPEVIDIVRGTPLEMEFKGQAGNKDRYLGPGWLQYMDKEGIDISVLNMNPWWYAADRDLARRVCDLQNEKTAEWVKRVSRSIRRHGDMRPAAPGPRRGAAGIRGQEAELPRCSNRRQRRRAGAVGSEVRSVLGQGRAARRHVVHAPAAGARHDLEPAARREGSARQHDRQSARDHRISIAPDFRGHARSFSGT